ncbi:MAG: hypothetical protein JWQ02_4507 [Capsulimonas sp.]|jgi:hypothetical protein|nr:hypothetical protein [Capsulimonas sp.]
MSSAHLPVPWPPDLTPEKAPVYNFHELYISASPAIIWHWLIYVQLWSRYNPYLSDIILLDPAATELMLGTSFQWRRSSYTLLSTVTDYLPYARIGWRVEGLWLAGFQEWLLMEDSGGCLVRVEETLSGFVPRLLHRSMSHGLEVVQHEWLKSLRRVAEVGPPPVSF